MRKALVTIAVGSHTELLKLSRPALELYSATHGYNLIIETELRDPLRPASWSKILAIRAALDNHDIVFWIDSDAIILRTDIDVLTVINESTHFAWVDHGDGIGHNAGVLFFRRSTAVTSFLSDIYDQHDLIHHTWWEQAAIMRILALSHHTIPNPRLCPPVNLNIQVLGIEWNAIRQVHCATPIIRHFPGETMFVRIVSMAEIILSKNSDSGLDFKLNRLKVEACEAVQRAQVNLLKLKKQNDALLLEKDLITSSISWQITKPLRWSAFLARTVACRVRRVCIACTHRP